MKTINLIFLLLLLASSCTYKIVETETIDPTDSISFNSQVLPIFTQNDNCTSCHKPGATSPDLTAPNAYQQLIDKNLVNINAPETSIIYEHISPETATHNWKKYSVTEAQTVLIWIEQGANNN